MFQIKKYLQYKNTTDGKPRVLAEGVDNQCNEYEYQDSEYLYEDFRDLDDGIGISKSGCRPLLTVEIDGVEWTEGDVLKYFFEVNSKTRYFMLQATEKGWGIYYYNGHELEFGVEDLSYIDNPEYDHMDVVRTKEGSFFDDPAKYSKLLWDCSEEEGWQKIFKLLNIEL